MFSDKVVAEYLSTRLQMDCLHLSRIAQIRWAFSILQDSSSKTIKIRHNYPLYTSRGYICRTCLSISYNIACAPSEDFGHAVHPVWILGYPQCFLQINVKRLTFIWKTLIRMCGYAAWPDSLLQVGAHAVWSEMLCPGWIWIHAYDTFNVYDCL